MPFFNKKYSVLTTPTLCSHLGSGEVIFHVSEEEKANCLKSYFASVSSIRMPLYHFSLIILTEF